jgi:hypothetical protein
MDEDEEIPDDQEDDEDPLAEDPLEVVRRCVEVTDLEPFELLKRDTEKWLQGQQDSANLRQCWRALEQELAVRHHYFHEGLRFQEWTEVLVVTGRQVFEQFEWIQDQMVRFDAGLEAGQELEMAYALEQIYAALVVLQQAYRTLRELQDDLPALSDSPLVAELIRVGQLAAQEKIPIEAFLDRVHTYCDMQERLHQALQLAQPAPREQAILEEERDNLEAAFETQQRGVEELLHFADTLDRAALERGLDLLEQGAQVQFRLRERLLGAVDEPDSRACPFCSASNEAHSRFCSACSARLPELQAAIPTTDPGPRLSSHFERLAGAVQDRLRGQLDEAQFLDTLRWFRNLYDGVCRQQKAQKPTPLQQPAEHKQLLQKAHESLQSGLELIGEGLRLLEAGEQLQDGLETVVAGGDRLLELNQWYEEASQLAHSLQER